MGNLRISGGPQTAHRCCEFSSLTAGSSTNTIPLTWRPRSVTWAWRKVWHDTDRIGVGLGCLDEKCGCRRNVDELHSLKLTARPWKMVVGRRSFPIGSRWLFRGKLVNWLLNFGRVWFQPVRLHGYDFSRLLKLPWCEQMSDVKKPRIERCSCCDLHSWISPWKIGSLKLTAFRTWKWMVGIRSGFLLDGLNSGATVDGRNPAPFGMSKNPVYNGISTTY